MQASCSQAGVRYHEGTQDHRTAADRSVRRGEVPRRDGLPGTEWTSVPKLARAFAIRSEALGARVIRALGTRFATRREGTDLREETYFDTFDWRVFLDDGTFSIRRDGDGYLAFWRTADGRLRHRLRSAQAPGFAWDFPAGPLRDALTPLIDVRRLLPVVEVRLSGRNVAVLDGRRKTVVRIVIDHGRASDTADGGRTADLSRTLRVTAVRGYDSSAAEVASFIEEEFALPAAEPNELVRALQATGIEPGGVPFKLALRLEPGQRADAAAKTIHRRLLEAMRRNEDGLRRNLDTEFLHDFRVAVRRTRSALGQIKDVLPADVVSRFREEFAWLGSLTGPLRDLDVYLLRMPEYRTLLPDAGGSDLDPLETFLRRRQAAEHARLVAGLDSARYSRLVDEWSRFLDLPLPEETVLPAARLPVEQVAAGRIRAVRQKVVDRGRRIGPATAASKLHRLRIDCKKLRYLLEFFGSLFDKQEVGVLVKSLKRLQDNLGDFNDLEVQQESLRRFAAQMTTDAATPESTLLAMGRLVERLAARQAELRERFQATFAKFDSGRNRKRFARLFGPSGAVVESQP